MGLARTVAVAVGAVYVLLGVTGFVVGTPLFGLFEVNPLHNIGHVVIGAILLYASMSTAAAIQATRGVGIFFLLVGALGFISADGFGLVPLGGHDIWLHLASGAILLATGLIAPEVAETSA